MIGVEYVASEGRVIQKMGPLGRVYPYFKRYYGRVKSFFHGSLCKFIRVPHSCLFYCIFKLRTSPFYCYNSGNFIITQDSR